MYHSLPLPCPVSSTVFISLIKVNQGTEIYDRYITIEGVSIVHR